MRRREFLAKVTGAGVVGAFVTQMPLEGAPRALGATRPVWAGASLVATMRALHGPLLKSQRNGLPFISSELNAAYGVAQIQIGKLGSVVTEGEYAAPVEEIMCPIVWMDSDEIGKSREEHRQLAESLLRNAAARLDRQLLDRLKRGRLMVSEHYRYDLSEIGELGRLRRCYLYTVAAQLPAGPHRAA